MALLDDLLRAGQTPWAQAQQQDWQNPGSNMASLPADQIMKLLGMAPPAPQAAAPQPVQRTPLPPPAMEPTASSIGKAFPQGGSGVLQQYGAGQSYQPGSGSDVKVSEAPQAAPVPQGAPVTAAPTPAPASSPAGSQAPPAGVGAPSRRPDFSMPTTGSDFLGGLLQGMGGMAKPIGELVSSQSGRTRATQSSNQTYDWLMRQGMSPEDAEFVTRNPNVLKAVLGQKFAVGKYGKTGFVFQDPQTGKFFTGQFGEDGTRRVLPLEAPGAAGAPGVPLAPAKGVKTVDDGTGTQIVSGATGDTVRRVEKDIVGRERQEKEGQALGELRAKLPTLKARMKGYEDKSARLDETIDRAISRIGVTTTGVGGALLQNLPMTEARALRGDLDTIRANVGFDELQAMRDASPTGGALGQVSNQENTLLQSVRAAIDQLLEGKDLEANLRIIKKSNAELREIQRQKLAEDEKRALGDAPITGTPSAGGWSIKRIE